MEKLIMKAGHQILHTIVIFLAILWLSEAKPRCLLFNFGDSNSDTGNAWSLLAAGGPDTGQLFFNRTVGRFCDGRLIIDFLCQNTSLPLLSPYMRSFDGDFHNGANFAISGARAMDVTCFSLKYQIRNFLSFRSLVAAHKASNIKINQHEYRSAVYMFDIGQNDIASTLDQHALYRNTNTPYRLDKSVAVIPPVIAETKTSIQTLYKEVGARKFWIHNTGPLGCLFTIGAGFTGPEAPPSLVLDSILCVEVANNASLQLNIQLRKLVEELRAELPGSSIVYVDMYSIKHDFFANYKTYGFLSPFYLGTGNISFDGIHYTERANSIVASKILSGQYSDPPIKFGDFCDA